VRDIFIRHMHPDTSARDALVSYPPSISAKGVPRFAARRLRIEAARVAIDMRGNSGGALLDDIEVSAFDLSIWIDGSLDSVRMNRIHIFPFGMSQQQRRIYSDGKTEGIRSGRCDDFQLQHSLVFGLSRAVILHRSKQGPTFGTITAVDFDDRGGLIVEEANVRLMGCVFTLSQNEGQWLRAERGLVIAVGCGFHSSEITSQCAGIDVGGSGDDVVFSFGSSVFRTSGSDFNHLRFGSGSLYTLAGLVVAKKPRRKYSAPILHFLAQSRGTSTGIVASSLGEAGGGTLVKAEAGAEGQIGAVSAPGWDQRIMPGTLQPG
jgi:hypothetical protein